jgi:hypothetical protein
MRHKRRYEKVPYLNMYVFGQESDADNEKYICMIKKLFL